MKQRRNRKRKNPYLYLAALIAALIMFWQGYGLPEDVPDQATLAAGETASPAGGQQTEKEPVLPVSGDGISVHFLDVGQASAALVVTDGHAMLIDTGNRDDAAYILGYLEELQIERLDYLILTHPHEDHIGSAAQILYEMDVDRVLLPDISIDDCETVIYAKVLAAIEEKDPIVDHPRAGDEYMLGEAGVSIVSPSPEWSTDRQNLNESSLGVLIRYGEKSFLVYGDGEKNCEAYMAEQERIQADVLAVAHHGSSTSNSREILEKIRPSYAVISCGADNKYGFPHEEVLTGLEGTGAVIYRTDTQGTVIISSDGLTIEAEVLGKEISKPETYNTKQKLYKLMSGTAETAYVPFLQFIFF